MTTSQTKTVALFASKLGYQTRSFESAARKLGVQLAYVTDRCHELSDPWGDHAIAARFASPEEAAATAMQSLRNGPLDGILALVMRRRSPPLMPLAASASVRTIPPRSKPV